MIIKERVRKRGHETVPSDFIFNQVLSGLKTFGGGGGGHEPGKIWKGEGELEKEMDWVKFITHLTLDDSTPTSPLVLKHTQVSIGSWLKSNKSAKPG